MDALKVAFAVAEIEKKIELLEAAMDGGDNESVGSALWGLKHEISLLAKMVEGELPAPARQGRGRR
jgi:hypothetical protein